MQGLQQYFQMVWNSIGHGIGPYVCASFIAAVMMPFCLDIVLSIAGIKTHLGEKALKFWGHWFIAWPVKTAVHAIGSLFKKKAKKKKKPKTP